MRGGETTKLGLSTTPQNKPIELKAIPDKFNTIMVGNIGTYPVRMELNRNENGFWGQYKYSNNPEATYLSIEGSLGNDGILNLKESDRVGNETGSFNGKFTNVVFGTKPTLRFDGNWSNAKTGKSLQFNLAEYLPNVGENLQVESKEIKTENKANKLTIDVRYPQISGSTSPLINQFNKYVSNYIEGQIKEFNKAAASEAKSLSSSEIAERPGNDLDGNYKTVYSDGKTISLQYNLSIFTGGAHPMPVLKTINYDLERGRPLALSDLFNPNSNYLRKISDYCIGVLKKRQVKEDYLDLTGAAPKAGNYQNWNISDAGLVITFEVYQIAPYAAGPQEIVVPYSVLSSVINPNNALAKFKK